MADLGDFDEDDIEIDDIEDEIDDIGVDDSDSSESGDGYNDRFVEMEVETERVDGLGVISAAEGISI
ncbi:MAG: hypothetical protein SXQ77_13620, partial [Halobacteria archaeon]|nr:hypothetical protein [Halobacteria archaeon]